MRRARRLASPLIPKPSYYAGRANESGNPPEGQAIGEHPRAAIGLYHLVSMIGVAFLYLGGVQLRTK
jgi:hypothetical protein